MLASRNKNQLWGGVHTGRGLGSERSPQRQLLVLPALSPEVSSLPLLGEEEREGSAKGDGKEEGL